MHIQKARRPKLNYSASNRYRRHEKNPVVPIQKSANENIVIKTSESLGQLESPMTLENFESLQNTVPNFLLHNIVERMNNREITVIQGSAIPILLQGHNLICVSPSDSGRILCYMLPIAATIIDLRTTPSLSAKKKEPQIRSPQSVQLLQEDNFVNTERQQDQSKKYKAIDKQKVEKEIHEKSTEVSHEEKISILLCVIIVPSLEIAVKVLTEAKKITENSSLKIAAMCDGFGPKKHSISTTFDAEILIAPPHRLIDSIRKCTISLKSVKFIVLDGIDYMIPNIPQIKFILNHKDLSRDTQTCMFSASYPPIVQQLTRRHLPHHVFIGFDADESALENVSHNFVLVPIQEDKFHALLGVLRKTKGRILIFVRQRSTAIEVARRIKASLEPKTEDLHGQKTSSLRSATMNRFENLETRIVVSTDIVLSKAMEMPIIDHVVQYDIPPGSEALDVFIHRISHAGRNGQTGVSTSLFLDGERTTKSILPNLVSALTKANQEVPMWMQDIISNQDHSSIGEEETLATDSALETKRNPHNRLHSYCRRTTPMTRDYHGHTQHGSYQTEYSQKQQIFQPYSHTSGGYIGQIWYPPAPALPEFYNMQYYPQYYSQAPTVAISPESIGMNVATGHQLHTNQRSYQQIHLDQQDRRLRQQRLQDDQNEAEHRSENKATAQLNYSYI